jgi:hypothetical protein
VSFGYKDYKLAGIQRIMHLDAMEFIRRFHAACASIGVLQDPLLWLYGSVQHEKETGCMLRPDRHGATHAPIRRITGTGCVAHHHRAGSVLPPSVGDRQRQKN